MFQKNRLMLFSGLLVSLFSFAQAYTQSQGFRSLASLPLNSEMARNNQALLSRQNVTTGLYRRPVINNDALYNTLYNRPTVDTNPYASAITNEQAYRQKQIEINTYMDQLKQERAIWSAQRGGQSFYTPYDAELRRLELATQSLNQARTSNITNSIIQLRFASTRSMTQAERDSLNEQATLLERLQLEMTSSAFQVMADTNLSVPAQQTVQTTLQQTTAANAYAAYLIEQQKLKDAAAATTTPATTPALDTQVTQTVTQPVVEQQPAIDPNLAEAVVPTIVN